jgi:transposase InsO family protein
LCDVLNLPRSTFYYEAKKSTSDTPDEYKEDVIRIFKANRKAYGTRRIKKALASEGKTVSRRRISRIMRENGLISTHTVAKYKVYKSKVNDEQVPNIVDRAFDHHDHLDVIVSDLTYVRVDGKWHYVCLILDLHNREIIGHSAGPKKDAILVYRAFASIKHDLSKINIFHTDRGSEFKNNAIDGLLETFNISRSLSKKGCPYDNAVAESTYKTFKVEFVYQNSFKSLEHLKLELFDYIHWFNHIRLHSSLGYVAPITYKYLHLNKVV